MAFVCIKENSIIPHGLVDAFLFVELELEVAFVFLVEIKVRNCPCIEFQAGDTSPPGVWNIHAKAGKQSSPFLVDGDRLGEDRRHRRMGLSKGVCIELLKNCVRWLWVVTLHFSLMVLLMGW